MSSRHEITRDDIIPVEEYAKTRKARHKALAEMKRDRRLEIGPHATFYFENYDTMWHQIHEMLYIERGGEAQIADELSAYNPLIPKGRELVATLMFEIEDAAQRHRILSRLGGVEETVTMEIDGDKVTGTPETDVDRTTAAGKASSVQFIHFPLTEAQAARVKAAGTRVVVGIGHPQYGHMAVMPERVRAALATDLD